MKTQWILNTYHKKDCAIIRAKRKLSNEEMDNIIEDYIESEKQKVENRIRNPKTGFIIAYTGK